MFDIETNQFHNGLKIKTVLKNDNIISNVKDLAIEFSIKYILQQNIFKEICEDYFYNSYLLKVIFKALKQ